MDDRLKEYLLNERALSLEIIEKFNLSQTEDGYISVPYNGRVHKIAPKYLNLPARFKWEGNGQIDHIFPKSALNEDKIIMVEGVLDALALQSVGINGITTGGATNFNKEMAESFKGKDVTLFLDNDDAGYKGTQKRIELLLPVAKSVRVARWSERAIGWDVTDELRTYGVGSVKELLSKAKREYSKNDFTKMSEVENEDISWVWKPYIPRGYITNVIGPPGDGKTSAMLNVAACLSKGYGMGGSDEKCLKGHSLLITTEDSPGSSILPKLVRMGADLDNISIYNGEFSISSDKDLEKLKKVAQETNAKLILFDPLQSVLGASVDINRANEVRPVNQKLASISEQLACAVVIIMHVNKTKSSRSFQSANGSMDFGAAARSVCLIGSDPDYPNERAMILVKSNIAAIDEKSKIGYTLEKTENGCDFKWTGETTLTASRILAPEALEDSRLQEAKEFLKEVLEDGPKKQNEIEADAEKLEVSMRTLRRAKKELKIVSKKEFGSGKWTWSLPEKQHDLPPTHTNIVNVGHDDESHKQHSQGVQDTRAENVATFPIKEKQLNQDGQWGQQGQKLATM